MMKTKLVNIVIMLIIALIMHDAARIQILPDDFLCLKKTPLEIPSTACIGLSIPSIDDLHLG